MRLAAGITVVNVPYKGSAEALSDLLGGRIDAMFDATPIEIPQVKAGAVSGVAVTGRERLSALPEVGTFAEGGFPVFADVSNYYVILATPATPPAAVQTLRDAIAKAVTAPDVIALFDKQGMKPVGERARRRDAHARGRPRALDRRDEEGRHRGEVGGGLSSSAEADDPVIANIWRFTPTPANTRCSAFAEHDSAGSPRAGLFPSTPLVSSS